MDIPISTIIGLTMTKVEAGSDYVNFHSSDGRKFKLHHYQDCCESVTIEDICGHLDDLVGSPITMAEESSDAPDNWDASQCHDDFYTWTFYRFATVKGYVTIRWYGTSNGYYSESVNFEEI